MVLCSRLQLWAGGGASWSAVKKSFRVPSQKRSHLLTYFLLVWGKSMGEKDKIFLQLYLRQVLTELAAEGHLSYVQESDEIVVPVAPV